MANRVTRLFTVDGPEEGEIRKALDTLGPNVVLSECRLPELAWTTVLALIEGHPRVALIIRTNSARAGGMMDCIRGGAVACLVKDPVGRLRWAVRAAMGPVLPEAAAEKGEALAEQPGPRGDSPRSALLLGEAHHILFVEDDDSLREVMTDALLRNGYVVMSCANAPEALGRAQADRKIDLLVTDVVMPGLSGRDLVDLLRAKRPGLRVLYVSGYGSQALALYGGIELGDRLLQKPFSERVFLEAVAAALLAGSEGRG